MNTPSHPPTSNEYLKPPFPRSLAELSWKFHSNYIHHAAPIATNTRHRPDASAAGQSDAVPHATMRVQSSRAVVPCNTLYILIFRRCQRLQAYLYPPSEQRTGNGRHATQPLSGLRSRRRSRTQLHMCSGCAYVPVPVITLVVVASRVAILISPMYKECVPPWERARAKPGVWRSNCTKNQARTFFGSALYFD